MGGRSVGRVTTDVPPTTGAGLRLDEPAGRWVLAATVLGSAVAFLDATVVNIALPAIGRDLGASTTGLTWTVNAYALTLAALVLVGGSLGDRLGRRRVFAVGVAAFGATSLACALAPTLEVLVAGRALQGVAAALLTPGALALLRATFRPEDRSRAIGAWSGLAGTAGAVGPLLGGWLVDVASWRWIFLINVPVVVVVLALTARHVPESRPPASAAAEPLDLGGAALAAVGLGALTFGLSSWAEGGGPRLPLAAVVVGLLGLAAFLAWEATRAHPMMPLDLFRARRFSATNLVTFLVYAALGGVFFWLGVTLQVVAGRSALEAGTSLLPVTVLMLLLSPRAGALGDRLGPRVPMTVGPLVAAVGVALLARIGPDPSYVVDVLLPVTLLGAGLTLTVTPLTATALDAVDEARTGLASGVNNAVARTGGLLLVAALPALVGLGADGFADPVALEAAHRTAMLVCAGALALGGLVAALTLGGSPGGSPGRSRGRDDAAGRRRHCAVDAAPVGLGDDAR